MVLNGGQHFQAMGPIVSRRGGAKSQVSRDARVLVDVPAASWECWDHGVDSQAGTPRKGRPTQKNWRATDPSNSGHQPHNWPDRRYFFNHDVVFKLWQGPPRCPRSQVGVPQVTHVVLEVAGWTSSGIPTRCWMSSRGFHFLVVSPVGSGPVSSWACGLAPF